MKLSLSLSISSARAAAAGSPGHDDIANEMLVRYLETTTCSANEIQRIVQSTKVLNRSLRFYHVVGSLLIQKGEYVTKDA